MTATADATKAAFLIGVLLTCPGQPALAWPSDPPTPEARPAIYSLEEIRRSVAESRHRLSSLRVEGLVEKQGGGWTRFLIAAEGPKRFARVTHFDDVFPEDLDYIRNDVYFDGESLNVHYPAMGWFERSRRNAHLPYSWKVRAPLLMECLGWWPPTDQTKPPRKGEPFFFHEALNQPGYRVVPQQARIDGAWCHIVERPGVDRIWFDPDLGFLPRRREWSEGNPPSLAVEYELADFKSIAEGVWFPDRVHRILYAPASKALRSKPPVQEDTTFRVQHAEVVTIAPEQFQFTPGPGTLINDLDSDEVIQVPGGLTFLDSVVALARERATTRAAHRDGPPAKETSWRGYIVSGAIVLLVATDLVLLSRFISGALRERVRVGQRT